MKSRTSKILLIGAMALSVSVMLASEAHKEKKFSATMQSEVSVSKMELAYAPTVSFTLHNYGYDLAGTINSNDYSFKREWSYVEYAQGKVQNKALPLSRKIWLLNCQIALK